MSPIRKIRAVSICQCEYASARRDGTQATLQWILIDFREYLLEDVSRQVRRPPIFEEPGGNGFWSFVANEFHPAFRDAQGLLCEGHLGGCRRPFSLDVRFACFRRARAGVEGCRMSFSRCSLFTPSLRCGFRLRCGPDLRRLDRQPNLDVLFWRRSPCPGGAGQRVQELRQAFPPRSPTALALACVGSERPFCGTKRAFPLTRTAPLACGVLRARCRTVWPVRRSSSRVRLAGGRIF